MMLFGSPWTLFRHLKGTGSGSTHRKHALASLTLAIAKKRGRTQGFLWVHAAPVLFCLNRYKQNNPLAYIL